MAEINQNYAYNNQAPNYTVPTQAAQYPPRQIQQKPLPPRRVYAQQKPQQPYIPPYYRPQDEGAQESFTERLKEADMMGVMTPFLEHPLAVLGTWLGFGVGLDAYAKACSGPYEKSLPAKAARLGDSIEQSAIVQSKPAQTILGWMGSGWKSFKKLAMKSEFVRAMVNTPTQPEWSITKSQMNSHEQELANEFTRLLHELNLDNENLFGEGHKGFSLGLTKKEKQELLTKFNKKNLSEIPEDKKGIYTLLKRFKIEEGEINKYLASNNGVQETKDRILKELGLDAKDLKKFTEDLSEANLSKIKEACKKASGKLWIGGGHYKLLGPLKFLFERKIEASKTCNEYMSIAEKGKGPVKTATGRFLSKAMQITHSGLTWRNGKLGALIFISPMLVEVGQNVIKADKDEKVGTAASGIINAATWILTFPLAVKIMHAFGGIKNAGLTADQVKARDELIRKFNEKAGSSWTDKIASKFDGRKIFECQFKDKATYNTKLKELKTAINEIYKNSAAGKHGFFKKAIKKIAGFLTLDLGNIKGYNGGNVFQKFIGGLPHFLKDLVGIPMRFAVWIFISTFVLDGIINKITTAIFGRAHNAEKDVENKENKKAQKEFLKEDLNNKIYELAKQKQMAVQPIIAQQRPPVRQNIIATKGHPQFKGQLPENQQSLQEESVDNYTYIPSQKNIIKAPSQKTNNDNYTYIPSQKNTIKTEKPTGNVRHYVPSQRAANIDKTFDNSGIQSALDKADKAEKKALKILGGNFEG